MEQHYLELVLWKSGLKHPSSGACVYLQRLVFGNVTGEVEKLGLKDVCILRSDKSVSLFLPGSSKSAFVEAEGCTQSFLRPACLSA